MFLKDGIFQELVLLSLNEGTTKLQSIYNRLSIFSHEEIINELVTLHNSKVITFDVKQELIIISKKMKATINFLSDYKIVEHFNGEPKNEQLAYLFDQMSKRNYQLNMEVSIFSIINNCLSFIYKTDFSHEISLLSLNSKK